MISEALVKTLLPAALELVPRLIDALSTGNKREARMIAEEVARRQAFELAQRAKSNKLNGEDK